MGGGISDGFLLPSEASLADSASLKVRDLLMKLQQQQLIALRDLKVEDTCETLTMITLRREESIFSDVITELPAGLDIKVLEIGTSAPRKRARVVAGNLEGWITVQTSFNEPLIRIKKGAEVSTIRQAHAGCKYKLKCMSQVRAGEELDSDLLGELGPGAVIRLLEVSATNSRRGRVASDTMHGWISLATSGGQLRVEGPLADDASPRLSELPPPVLASRAAEAAAEAQEEAEARAKVLLTLETAKQVAEDNLMSILKSADPTAGELRVAANTAAANGVEPRLVKQAEKLAGKQEVRRRLSAAVKEDGNVDGLRAAIAAATRAGIPDREISEAQGKLKAEERKQRAMDEVRAVTADAALANAGSVEQIRGVKARLVEVVRRARDQGVDEVALKAADAERKRLHNAEEDLKGAIRVFCRVRPLSQREIENGDTQVVSAIDSTTVSVQQGRHAEPYPFDAVFVPGSQEEVFDDCKRLVQSALDGYNVTLFAYGQTGAGKTYTMYGSRGSEGTAPRTIQELFRVIERDASRYEHEVSASMMELYRNELLDLLAPRSPSPRRRSSAVSGALSGGSFPSSPMRRSDSNASGALAESLGLPRLAVKTDLRTGGVQIENLTEEPCESAEELQRLLDRGSQQRRVASTAMNSQSSRSHLLLTVRIARTSKATGERTHSKITLCDLAGSERLKRSEAVGDTQKEAIEINKSLTAIGDVVEALTTGQRHVPYKNHKLTQVLQDALGGTSKTLMFVNCSPASSNVEETVNALKYAMRVKKIAPSKRGSVLRAS